MAGTSDRSRDEQQRASGGSEGGAGQGRQNLEQGLSADQRERMDEDLEQQPEGLIGQTDRNINLTGSTTYETLPDQDEGEGRSASGSSSSGGQSGSTSNRGTQSESSTRPGTTGGMRADSSRTSGSQQSGERPNERGESPRR